MTDELPAEFDPVHYRNIHIDLVGKTDAALLEHYEEYGRREGRSSSPASQRKAFLKLVPKSKPVLEIGPFDTPCVTGSNVRYFDVLDQAALQRRAAELGRAASAVPSIDYVDSNGDLAAVTDTFAALVSSHCIEHQPDLVYHLQQAGRMLEPGGRYFLLIPNKLYCFDHYIAESTIANVLDAHRAKHRVHRLESVIEHRALTTHNDPARHWAGDHADASHWATIVPRIRASLAEYDGAGGGYIDVHAWQFTPLSFRRITQYLLELGLTQLRPERTYDTPHGSNEFAAVLQKI